MKKIFQKTPNWILGYTLLGLLTVSCAPKKTNDPFDISKLPSGPDFTITGKVTDTDKNPIENIKVFINGNDKESIVYTDNKGEFSVLFRNFSCLYYELLCRDVDGKEYGGEFKDQIQLITFKESDLKDFDPEKNYRGRAKKTVDITLELKNSLGE